LNQSENNDLETIYAIAKQLRVPELSYRMVNVDELSNEIASYFGDFISAEVAGGSETVLKQLISKLGKRALPAKLNNLAFISDRIFDVWGRKNKLSDDIQCILNTWRYPFFKVMYQTTDSKNIEIFITLIDTISNDALGWEPKPERSKRIFLDELNNISVSLFNFGDQKEQNLESLLVQWQVFFEKQASKTLKIAQRLELLEARRSWEE
jgi:hypothetical protein